MSDRADGNRQSEARGGILLLPRTRVLRREFLLPTARPRELRKILGYRIPLETPFLAGEITWDWRVVEAREDGTFLVRVSIVEKAAFARQLAEAGLGRRLLGLLVEDDYFAMLGAGGDEIHVLAHQGRVLALRVRGGECIRSVARALAGNGRAETAAALVRELIAAETGANVPVRSALAETIPLPAGLEAGPPLETGVNGKAAALPGGGGLLPARTRRPRGLRPRMRAGRALLPDAWQLRGAGRKVAVRFLLTLVAAALLAAGFGAIAGELAGRALAERAEIDASRSWLQTELEQVQAAQMLITNVTAWGSRGREILAAWDRVAEKVPAGVNLTALSVQEGGRVVIQGQAKSRGAIVSFIEELRADDTGLFAELALGGLEERGGRQHFNIDALLREKGAAP